MKNYVIEDLRQRKRRQYLKLIEFVELTEQLDQSLKHKDEVTAKIFISMREAPLTQMNEIEEGIKGLLLELPEEDAAHMENILCGKGAEEPESGGAEEKALREQVLQYTRLLRRASELDERVSRSLYGKQSFYNKFR